MDADAMVTKARNWTHVPKQVSCRVTVQGSEWYVNNNRPTSVQIPVSTLQLFLVSVSNYDETSL